MSVGSLEELRVGGLQRPEFCPNIYTFGNRFFSWILQIRTQPNQYLDFGFVMSCTSSQMSPSGLWIYRMVSLHQGYLMSMFVVLTNQEQMDTPSIYMHFLSKYFTYFFLRLFIYLERERE